MSIRRKGRERVAFPDKIGETPPQVCFDAMAAKGPFLLGIDFCHIRRKAAVLLFDGSPMPERWFVEENTGMAGVIPAWKIMEVLNRKELIAMREQSDQEITERKNSSGASLDVAERDQQQKEVFTQSDFEAALKKASRKIDHTKS